MVHIRINNRVIGLQAERTRECPAGTAYWHVDCLVDGTCVYSMSTEAIYGSPNVLGILDAMHEVNVEVPAGTPDAWQCSDGAGRKLWLLTTRATHRERLTKALAQLA